MLNLQIFLLQEKLYGKSIVLADRETVEEKADDILFEARSSDVAFLVVGDPFGYLLFYLISVLNFLNFILLSKSPKSKDLFVCLLHFQCLNPFYGLPIKFSANFGIGILRIGMCNSVLDLALRCCHY